MPCDTEITGRNEITNVLDFHSLPTLSVTLPATYTRALCNKTTEQGSEFERDIYEHGE